MKDPEENASDGLSQVLGRGFNFNTEVMCEHCSGSGIGPSGDTEGTCYECGGTGASNE